MTRQAPPKSTSVDEDGDVDMSGATRANGVTRNSRPVKKQKTKANPSDSEDGKPVETPRVRSVMVRVEGKTPKKQTTLTSFFKKMAVSPPVNAEIRADDVTVPVRRRPSLEALGYKGPAAKSSRAKKGAATKTVASSDVDSSDSDVKPTRRRGRKRRADTDDEDDFVPEEEAPSEDDFVPEEEVVSSGEDDIEEAVDSSASDDDEPKPRISRPARRSPKVEQEDSGTDPEGWERVVTFKPNGLVKKESYTCVQKPCGLKIAPRDGDLPPLSRLDLIFEDIISRPDAVKALMGPNKYRRLRVATMCSGTESPLLALEMFSRAIKKRGWGTLEIEHVFSCEIEPFKQAYIERNFKPPILFRDIRELGRDEATTAYGAKVKVPGDVDLLVAGTSCVDFSNLNNKQKGITAGGESGDTFLGMMSWVRKHRPTIVIQENVNGAYWAEMRHYYRNSGYSAEYTRLDSKYYYIPHTRQRGYLFAFNQAGSDIPNKWIDAVKLMKRNATATFEAFMLPDDDPRVYKARVELAGDPRTGGPKAARTHDWEKCEGRHQRERINHQIGNGRPITAWEEGGVPKLLDFQWQDWGRGLVQRVLDLMDINYLQCIKLGYDPMYKAAFWNLSQNVDRNTMGGIPKGISPCLTPTMIPYLTYRGGPMTGIETLHMQGLPINELILTRETSKQIQDMAGNAMSSTVVGTAMLMALVLARNHLKERPPPDGMDLDNENDGSIRNRIVGDEELVTKPLDLSTTAAFDIRSVLEEAQMSARLCICEGRTAITKDKIRLCSECGFTVCEKCGGRPPHVVTAEKQAPMAGDRLLPLSFERKIKSLLPMRLVLDKISSDIPDRIKESNQKLFKYISANTWKHWKELFEAAITSELRFKTLLRHETWIIIYESPAARLELVLDAKKPHWRLYPVCPEMEGLNSTKRKLSCQPLARMFLSGDGSALSGNWELNMPTVHTFQVTVRGVGKKVPSFRNRLGLEDPKSLVEEVWEELEFSVPEEHVEKLDVDISGIYKLLPDCGTAMGALHIRKSKVLDEKPLFLFLDQERIGDASNDSFVFAHDFRRLQLGETRPLVAKLAPTWRQFSNDKTNNVMCTVVGQWQRLPNVRLAVPIDADKGGIVKMPSPRGIEISADLDSCCFAKAILHCEVPLKKQAEKVWPRGQWVEIDEIHERGTFEEISWLTERTRFPGNVSNWINVSLPKDLHCERCAPTPPALKWVFVGKKYVAFEDAEQAAPYERAIKERPRPVVTHMFMDDYNRAVLKIGLNVSTLLHRALARLPQIGNVKAPVLSWRLVTDYVPEPKVMLPFYKLSSNKKDPEHSQPPNFVKGLRPEQLRSLTWMLGQEKEDVEPFMEEEVAEALFPYMNWRLEGRVERPNICKGGVLADEVGYGKTAISIGLIDCTHADVKVPEHVDGAIPVKATIIVIPGHLNMQWPNEIRKFTGSKYNVLEIKNFGSLKNITIKDIMNADIVLVSSSVFSSNTYHTSLGVFAGARDVPNNDGRRFIDWHTSAQKDLAEQVDRLRNEGSAMVLKHIKEAAERLAQEAKKEAFIQRKRLKGSAYAAAKALTSKKKELGIDDGSDNDKSEEEDATPDEDELPFEDLSMTDDEKTSPTDIDRSRYDPWCLSKSNVKADWRNMRSPLLDMFKFNRLIVDEFTYLNGKVHRSITGLKADRRWVLSGTPPLEDFADVKTISVFMNLHLGIDDELASSRKNSNRLTKDRTDVEQFTNFAETRSPYWYHRRQEVAQKFLNQFVRQNFAEIDEIPSKEHLVPVELPAAERAIYLELDHYLQAMDYNMRRSRAKVDNDRDRRQQEALGDSKTAEEALIKRCSHFDLNIDQNEENAVQACDMIVAERQEQLHQCREDIRRTLRDAVKRYSEIRPKDFERHNRRDIFGELVKIFRENGTGDPAANHDIIQMLNEAFADENDKPDVVYADGTIADPVISESPSLTKKNEDEDDVQYTKAGKPKKRQPKKKKKEEEEPIEKPWPKEMSEKIEQLKNKAFYLRTVVRKELVGRHRSLRYFTVVRDLQKFGLRNAESNKGITDISCLGCGRKNLHIKDAAVISSCGHQGCYDCLKKAAVHQKCLTEHCEAATRALAVIKAESLGTEKARDSVGRHYGRKLEKVVELITKHIPKNEKILLFVQFPDLYKKVAKVLEYYKISYLTIEGTAKKQGELLSKFQSDDGPRVLLLNVMQQSSAGSNLTNANHAILLSPLLTETEYEYKASETQAIGRVLRYGQTKTVHIWRFMTKGTMDIEIFEKRTGKTLEDCKEQIYEI